MIVLFDLDYTLTRRGTWGRFVWSAVRRRPWLWLPLICGTVSNQIDYRRGRTPRGTVKRSMMRWSLRHCRREEILRLAADFADKEVRRLRPGAVRALRHHLESGDTVVVASAAVDLIVQPLCERLGIAHYVCTPTAWDGEKLSACSASRNCYGESKHEAVACYLRTEGLGEHADLLYTDSRADFALAPIVDRIVVVNPKARTREEATRRRYPIENWNT